LAQCTGKNGAKNTLLFQFHNGDAHFAFAEFCRAGSFSPVHSLRLCCTAARSAPVPLPWMMVTVFSLASTARVEY
jgi:hypothetical protein